MTKQVFTTPLIAAVAAAVTTLTIFSAVVGLAEPQRGVVLAKAERAEQLAQAQRAQQERQARAALTVAANAPTQIDR